MSSPAAALADDAKAIVAALPAALRSVRARLPLVVAGGAVLTGTLAALTDAWWATRSDMPFGAASIPWAKAFSRYGEIHGIPLVFAVVLWTTGYCRSRADWRRAALAALMAAAAAGLAAACLKGLIGRARPEVGEAWRLVGPVLKSTFQSFPSGHTTHSVGFTAALLLLDRRIGLVSLVLTAGVIWARLALHKHYFSDIAGGATLGLLGALVFAAAAKRGASSRP